MTLGVPTLMRAANLNSRLRVAHIGLGGQGRIRLGEILRTPAESAVFCDVDETMRPKAEALLPTGHPAPPFQVDYREVITRPDVDAVLIATPDHWHVPIALAALQAGKHVFCEKPLGHCIHEVRALRELSQQHPELATQMGNQGSASDTLRRGIEIIQAGLLGPVREVHCWIRGMWGTEPGARIPAFGDPIPAGLHWDAWLGPAPERYYHRDIYHPYQWRRWYDFGTGVMGNFGCHALNLPFRALQLDYPQEISVRGEYLGLGSYSGRNRIRFDFAARASLPPVTVWWYDAGRQPPDEVIPASVVQHFGEVPDIGVLVVGENGFTFGDCWNGSQYLQLKGETKLQDLRTHPAGRDIPHSLPRVKGHVEEWLAACAGGPPTFSNFELGGHLTEIALAGIVGLRTDRKLKWNGPEMRAENTSRADQYVSLPVRTGWKI